MDAPDTRLKIAEPLGAPTRRTHARFIVIALLFLHTVNTYMDRAVISSAVPHMQSDLGIGDQMMGYVLGVFAVGYALFQIPAGSLADRLGPRRVLTAVVLFWSAFTMLTGMVRGAVSLLFIRFFFGVGEAGAFPGATSALYKWVPAHERGIAQGFFHSGARVGAAISLLLMPLLIDAIGWRLTFAANGVAGIVWVTAWWLWFRDDPARHWRVGAAEREYIERGLVQDTTPSARLPFGQIVTSGNMLLAMFQYIASNITNFISFSWLQPYLIRQYGDSAKYYAPIALVFAMLAHWTAGALVTFLHSRGYPVASRRLPAAAGFAISVAGLLLTTQMTDAGPLVFVLCFSVAAFGAEMTISPSWAFCMDIGGGKSGAVSGAMNMLGNLGAAFSAIIFPYFVAHVTLPYFAEATGTANSFFVFAAGMNALGMLAWLFMNPRRKLEAISPRQVRLRLILFIAIAVLLVGGAVIYTNFFMKKG